MLAYFCTEFLKKEIFDLRVLKVGKNILVPLNNSLNLKCIKKDVQKNRRIQIIKL